MHRSLWPRVRVRCRKSRGVPCGLFTGRQGLEIEILSGEEGATDHPRDSVRSARRRAMLALDIGGGVRNLF